MLLFCEFMGCLGAVLVLVGIGAAIAALFRYASQTGWE